MGAIRKHREATGVGMGRGAGSGRQALGRGVGLGVVVGADAAVALDRGGVALARLVGILAVLAQCAALAQVVPGLIELGFQLAETGVVLGAEPALALVAAEQRLLLLDELVDAAEDLLVVHGFVGYPGETASIRQLPLERGGVDGRENRRHATRDDWLPGIRQAGPGGLPRRTGSHPARGGRRRRGADAVCALGFRGAGAAGLD